MGLTAARVVLLTLTRRWAANGSLRRNVAIVGTGADAERLLDHIASSGDPTVRIVGVFDNRSTRVPKAWRVIRSKVVSRTCERSARPCRSTR